VLRQPAHESNLVQLGYSILYVQVMNNRVYWQGNQEVNRSKCTSGVKRKPSLSSGLQTTPVFSGNIENSSDRVNACMCVLLVHRTIKSWKTHVDLGEKTFHPARSLDTCTLN
jgi:hypothetical protein